MNKVVNDLISALAITSLVISGQAAAQDFDPRTYQDDVVGKVTEVMILGTDHLSGAPESWSPKALDPLLERLAAFKPDIIATEYLSGPSVHKLWLYRDVSPQTAATYGGRAMRMALEAGMGLDMDMPRANAALRKRLSTLPEKLAPEDRRQLVALFAAAGDPLSALVQWWQLPDDARIPADGISKRLVTMLNELGNLKNEGVTVATRLAVGLGLVRLYPMDAQDDDIFTEEEADIFAKKVFPAIAERYRADPLLKGAGGVAKMIDGQATLAEYRKINGKRMTLRSAEIEWKGAIDRASPQDVGRKRIAGWEVRNLRMAANIREATARAPGGRVLVIVGGAHKIWLEAYLGMMADIHVVSTDTVLE